MSLAYGGINYGDKGRNCFITAVGSTLAAHASPKGGAGQRNAGSVV